MKDYLKKRSGVIDIFLLSILLFLAGVFFLTLRINRQIKQDIKEITLSSAPLPFPKMASYPVFSQVLGVKTAGSSAEKLEEYAPSMVISAQAAVIMDDESKVVLYSKNSSLRFSLASTTKIMTALVALEEFQMDDVLEIKSKDVEGTLVGFEKGEKVKVKDMLYAMMLASGNDAALAIAQNYKGGEKAFIEKMNEKAQELNLSNTHFSDSSGLKDQGDFSTAFDLAHLSSIAIKHPLFSEIVGTKQKVITTRSGNRYSVSNINKLLGFDGVNGIKTGQTDEAGQVLVTSKVERGKTYIIVVMKSEDRFGDTEKLLSIIKNNVSYIDFSPI